mmetsp:Transcript_26181/g.39638  ORF Transcript_26181/g.39638 Transcript_26181/m.39638 type:complete len:268 (+) Transcript_26181:140-943(+)
MRFSFPFVSVIGALFFVASDIEAIKITVTCDGISATVNSEDFGLGDLQCPSQSALNDLVAEDFEECTTSSISCSNDCLGEQTLLYNCKLDTYVEARDIVVGDAVGVMTPSGPACSDVYYKWQHEDKFGSFSFEVEDSEEPIVVSDNHLLYVGKTFGEHTPMAAKNVQVGDFLVTKDGAKKIVSVDEVMTGLVNILTYNPALELKNGVIISAHSYSEDMYGYAFMPFKLMYNVFGNWMAGVFDNHSFQKMLLKGDYYIGYAISALSLN